jgi:membrane protease YdiL (CAAX protease family)
MAENVTADGEQSQPALTPAEGRPGRLPAPARVLMFVGAYLLFLFATHTAVVMALWRYSTDGLAAWTAFRWYLHSPFRWALEGVPAVVLVVAFRRGLDRRSVSSLGLTRGRSAWGDLVLGLFFGAVLISGAVILLLFTGRAWILDLANFEGQSLAFILGQFAVQGGALIGACFAVELVVRGYLLQNLRTGLSPAGAILGASFIGVLLQYPSPWMVLHPPAEALHPPPEGASPFLIAFVGFLQLPTSPTSVLGLLNLGLLGCLLGTLYLLTGSLWTPLGAHLAWVSLPGLVYGVPVNGLRGFYHLLQVRLAGDPLLTGGPFGPAGGLYATAVLLGGLCMLLWAGREKGN